MDQTVKFKITPIDTVDLLYDREDELKKLKNLLEDTPIIALLGPRRCGKTSLIKVLSNEISYPYIYLDMREVKVSSKTSKIVLIEALEKGLNEIKNKDILQKLIKYLKRFIEPIEEVSSSYESFAVKIRFKRELGEKELFEIFSELDNWAKNEKKKLVIFLDEAGLLVEGDREKEMYQELLRAVHDNKKNLRIILTGSEISLIMNLLEGIEFQRVSLGPFSEETSKDFLREGLKNLNSENLDEEINIVISNLGGIPGWLSHYGYYRKDSDMKKALEKVKKEAEPYVKSELNRLLNYFYNVIGISKIKTLIALEYIGRDWKREKKVREYLEKRLNLNKKDTSKILDKLEEFSFLEKRNGQVRLVDPMHYEFIPEVLDRILKEECVPKI